MTEIDKNIALLTDIQYFGSINWIKNASKYTNIKIEQYENWQKGGFRNRTYIAGAGGANLLTIPILHGRDQHTPIHSLKIAYRDNWVAQHIRTIESCYRRAPWYEHYSYPLYEILESRPENLIDLNELLLWKIRDWLFPDTLIQRTDSYQPTPELGVEEGRGIFQTRESLTNPTPPIYQQVFEDRNGFLPGMSILDLLFCCGPNAKALLKDNE
jgi:hypothetical protein